MKSLTDQPELAWYYELMVGEEGEFQSGRLTATTDSSVCTWSHKAIITYPPLQWHTLLAVKMWHFDDADEGAQPGGVETECLERRLLLQASCQRFRGDAQEPRGSGCCVINNTEWLRQRLNLAAQACVYLLCAGRPSSLMSPCRSTPVWLPLALSLAETCGRESLVADGVRHSREPFSSAWLRRMRAPSFDK
ncbi:hypothetical protein CTRI78_v009345 [Colletotrichum trifolii]|uniref:Uncharacterized protein n=1 Tax=Colletotrichum trifolii TaxID=5466 RepID=A0A4R8QQY3_COLTR|nr:hypothetical protein CTRI78_v009345 [Colletotrichum trifolii]